MAIRIEQTKFDQVPTGAYPAVIADLEMVTGQYGEQIQWQLKIEQPGTDWDGIPLSAWTSAKFSPKSKLYAWTRAAFDGKDIPTDYTWNSEHLMGKRVMVVVVEKIKPDGTEFSKVEDLRPMKPLVAAPAQQTAAAVQQPWAPPPVEPDDFPF